MYTREGYIELESMYRLCNSTEKPYLQKQSLPVIGTCTLQIIKLIVKYFKFKVYLNHSRSSSDSAELAERTVCMQRFSNLKERRRSENS